MEDPEILQSNCGMDHFHNKPLLGISGDSQIPKRELDATGDSSIPLTKVI